MKLTKQIFALAGTALALMVIVACVGAVPASPGDATPVRAPTQIPAPTPAIDKDSKPDAPEVRPLVPAPIEGVEIIIAESFPPQYFVAITLGLPNACYDFSEASVERDGSVVRINVTNLAPAGNQMCAEIYRTIVENVALGSDFDPDIEYTVEVNGRSYPLTQGDSASKTPGVPPGVAPGAPAPTDPALKEVPAPIESAHINITNRQTAEATLTVVSGLPGGCASLSRFETNQRGDLIIVDVLNNMPSGGNTICTAIYGTVENKFELTGSYTACETYKVEINGEIRKIQAIDPAVRCGAPEAPTTSLDREPVPAPIENVQIIATKSLPPQYIAVITAGLPNACYDFDGYEVTFDGATVRISVTNLAPADPNAMCAEIYRTVDVRVPLGSDFEPGIDYTVEVNGKTTPLTPGFSAPPAPPSAGGDAEYGSPFTLTERGAVSVGSESLVITLESVEDSRCPADVDCVWQGQAKITLSAACQGVSLGQRELILEPQQSVPATTNLGEFLITFVSLEPYPTTEVQTPSQSTATLMVQPKGSVLGFETGPDNATAKLSAQLVDGSPLTILLAADIVGGADDDQDLNCQGVTWSFGDGNGTATMPGCIMFTKGSTFVRHWEETYTYENPGKYQVSFTYGPLPTATAQVEL